MGSGFWIESVYGPEYGFKILNASRIFIRKRMKNVYWVVCVFRIVSVFGM